MFLATTEHGLVSTTLSAFIAMLAFASVIGVLSKFVKIPYTIHGLIAVH